MNQKLNRLCALIIFLIVVLSYSHAFSQKVHTLGSGWAANSVNATIFRKNSVVSNEDYQYVAYYDSVGYLTLGRRSWESEKWIIQGTQYKGNVRDAHNSISLMLDGDGYLHISWDHHNTDLNYAKTISPGSLVLTEKMPMTGLNESNVSYPEFYRDSNGDLLFFYRNGSSGNGNLIINKYDTSLKKWKQVQNNLISGEGERNAYWQVAIDSKGTIHLSWVWRESWDVATNHDLCYAKSYDGGVNWVTSKEKRYELPIIISTAEIACSIRQNSELINQTSMSIKHDGLPVIATYWKSIAERVQFKIVYLENGEWKKQTVSRRLSDFSLSGGGTKRIPVSRPQVICSETSEMCMIIFRDEERANRPSVFIRKKLDEDWEVFDLLEDDLGLWEPSFDSELWKRKGVLSLYIQRVDQLDSEGISDNECTPVRVLDWSLSGSGQF